MRSPFPYDSYPGPDLADVDPLREAMPSKSSIRSRAKYALHEDPDMAATDLHDSTLDWVCAVIWDATGRDATGDLYDEICEIVSEATLTALGA